MSDQLTPNQHDLLSTLILFHSQKVIDHTRAVPNVGLAKRHNEFVEVLKKAQTILRGDPVTCAGCIREFCDERISETCLNCIRNVEVPDNFKRRST